jgi:hypothetical protein
MNPPPAALSKDVSRAHQEIRSPKLGPTLKRERLLQRVRLARKRVAANSADYLGKNSVVR